MVLGGMFSVTLSVTQDLHPGRPRFHGACCLPVFGLSSGDTSVKPAITRHGRETNTKSASCPRNKRYASNFGDRILAGLPQNSPELNNPDRSMRDPGPGFIIDSDWCRWQPTGLEFAHSGFFGTDTDAGSSLL